MHSKKQLRHGVKGVYTNPQYKSHKATVVFRQRVWQLLFEDGSTIPIKYLEGTFLEDPPEG